MNQFIRCAAVSCAVLIPVVAFADQDSVDGFQARTYTGAAGTTMPYRLFIPDAAARARALPLIVYLHGGGGAGNDNLRQISGGNTAGTHVWTTREMQARHPAFVVAPQIPGGRQWGAPSSDELAPYATLVLDLLAALSKEFAIDADRIYITGQSLGGRGTWDLVSKRPDIFAGAIPVCGDGNTTRIRAARDVSIWAFHGAKDPVVPVAGSRDMVAALKSAGSRVKYTEYPDVEHNAWVRAFAERELPDWLFAQRRNPQARPAPNSFAARWERGGMLRVSEGKRTVRINLSEDFVGCLGELHDPTTRKRFGRGEGPNKVLDVTEAEGHRFILLTALAAPNCNVQGQCGAGDANVTLIWLNLAPDLSVVAKKTFTVADCVAPRWVDQDDPYWHEKLAFVDGVLTINFTEVGKRTDTGEMDDIPGRVSYDRKAASAGFSVTRSTQ